MEISRPVLSIVSSQPDIAFCDRNPETTRIEIPEFAGRMERGIYDKFTRRKDAQIVRKGTPTDAWHCMRRGVKGDQHYASGGAGETDKGGDVRMQKGPSTC